MKAVYLTSILAGAVGVLALDRRLATGVASRRFARSAVVTVPFFLAFDLLGAARGWFSSDPHRNVLIVPPGIPLEEPILLTFLTLVSVVLWHVARKILQ